MVARAHDHIEAVDSGLASLITLAGLHQVAADRERLVHEFGRAGQPFTLGDIVRAARWLGLRADSMRCAPARLAATPLPAIGALRDGGFVIIAAVRDEQVLLQYATEQAPRTLPLKAFVTYWDGRLVLLTRRATTATSWRHFDFSWFVPFILKYRRYLGEVLLASFFLQLFALITPLFFQLVIDKVLVHRGLTTLDLLAVGLLVVSVFEVLLGGLRTYVFAHTSSRIDVALGAAMFRHLLRLPLAWFEARRVGDSVARVRELETIRSFITGSALTVAVDAVFTVVFFAALLIYSPLLTAIVAATVPAYALLALTISPVLRARLDEKFNRGADNQAFLVEVVSGMRTLKAAAVEPATRRRWDERLAAYVQAGFRTTQWSNLANQCAALINKLMVLGVLWVGAHEVMAGRLSVGQLVAFNLLAARVSAPLLRVLQLWQDFQQAGVSVQRLGDILNAATEPAHAAARASLPGLRGAVTFEGVAFRYRPGGSEVLSGLDLQVSAGEVIGVVGPSGSGKSTLGSLIQRLYVPERGRVLVDGVDLAMVDVAWLRGAIGVVLQDNVLFNRSVRENIALIDPAMPMARVEHAARLAGAHEFILELEHGYDSMVGEQGAGLSGGQRQRIAIARALVGDPRILILDEASSALDYEAETRVQQNMRHICRGRTVFIIAHRLSALRPAGRIVVLERGRVTAQGTHEELLQQGGYYCGLVRAQLAFGNPGTSS